MAGGGAEGGGGSHLECIKQNNTSQHLSSPGRTLGRGREWSGRDLPCLQIQLESYRMNAAARKHGAAPPEASFVSVKYSGGRSLSFSDNKRDLCFTGDSGHIARDKPRLLLWVQGSAV